MCRIEKIFVFFFLLVRLLYICMCVYIDTEEESLKISDCILLTRNSNICKNLGEMGSFERFFGSLKRAAIIFPWLAEHSVSCTCNETSSSCWFYFSNSVHSASTQGMEILTPLNKKYWNHTNSSYTLISPIIPIGPGETAFPAGLQCFSFQLWSKILWWEYL